MGLRNTLVRVAPGLFTTRNPRIMTMDEPAAKQFVRAAGLAIYPTTDGWPGMGNFIVPNFDDPHTTKQQTNDQLVRQNPFLFAPVWRQAMRLGAIPIKVYEFTTKNERRTRQEAMDHPLYNLFRKPNPDLTRNLLISGTVMGMYAYKGVGWYKERAEPAGPRIPSNPVVAVWPIPAHLLTPLGDSRRLIVKYRVRTFEGNAIDIPATDIVFHRLMPDMLLWNQGITPMDTLSDVADFSNAGLNAMRSLFRSSFLQRLFMNLHGQVLDDDLIDRLRAEVESALLNPYSVPIMEGGATLDTMGAEPTGAILENSFQLTKQVVNDAFGMSDKIDDLQHYYSEVIQPVADGMEQEWERSLVPDFEGDVFPQFAFRQLLEGSPEERAKLHQIRILSGQETPNEARSDEDKPPVPGGDQAFVPLNEVPMTQTATNGSARQKDTKGGLGGDVGQGTTAKLSLPKAASSNDEIKLRAAAVEGRWEGVRNKVLDGQAEALERRLRGAINNERDQLRARQAPDGLGQLPARIAARAELYDPASIDGILNVSDQVIRSHLESFMRQASTRAGQAAIDLTGQEELSFRTEDAELFLQQRIDMIVERFGTRRRERLQEIVARSAEVTAGQLDAMIREEWDGLANHLASRIGTTETAWAFERGAALGWGSAGYPDFVVHRTGDSCRTGMCVEVATAGRYQYSDVPTPLHPGCRCLILPAGFVG